MHRVRNDDLDAEVIRLRERNYSFPMICERVPYSVATAKKCYYEYLAKKSPPQSDISDSALRLQQA